MLTGIKKAIIALLLLLCVNSGYAGVKVNLHDMNVTCIESDVMLGLVVQYPAQLFEKYGMTDLSQASQKTTNAVNNLNIIYHFFDSQFDWKSVDGKDANITLLTNIGEGNRVGCDGRNAFFANIGETNLMVILFGYPGNSLDIANDIDVIAHEFSHGIFAATRGSSDRLEVRALNESIADMFGVSAAVWQRAGQRLQSVQLTRRDFAIGENTAKIFKLYNNNYRFDAIRNMANPYQYNEIGHYDELESYVLQHRDAPHGPDVHGIAGITNMMFYLLSHGGTQPRYNGQSVAGIGLEKTIKLIFYTLKHYPVFNSMPDFAKLVKKSAAKLYGKNSKEWLAAHNAFVAVGLLKQVISAQPDASLPAPAPVPESQPERETETESEPAPVPEASPEPLSTSNSPFTLSGLTFIYILLAMVCLMLGFVLFFKRSISYQDQSEIKPSTDFISVTNEQHKTVFNEPHTVNIILQIKDHNFTLTLSQTPLILGRQVEYLTAELLSYLRQDESISRKHCELWYKYQTNELYIRNLSVNKTQVEDYILEQDDKVKLLLDEAFNITIGNTRLIIKEANNNGR